MLAQSMLIKQTPLVLLASADESLIFELRGTLYSLGFRIEIATSGDQAIAALGSLETTGVLLLEVRLPGVANGQLLAAIHELGLRQRSAIALLAEQVSDEWIARLREGAIDDIVPRNCDAAAWLTHLSTMQRGHQLYCELEYLRESALMEAERDAVTGLFHRETMLSILFRETDRVQRLRGALCLVSFRVDDFGHRFEELGAGACDGLLREIARRAGRSLRSYDLLGRSGKDEFLLALPGCSTINAVMMAERLRTEVFGEPFAVQLGARTTRQIRLTASFGIASSRGRSPVVVVREAEETVARAALAGPHSIRCASEPSLLAEASGEVGGLCLAKLFPGAEAMV